MDDMTVNWKLVGSVSSQIITVSRYESIEVVQFPALLTIWSYLERKFRNREAASQSLKSGRNLVL